MNDKTIAEWQGDMGDFEIRLWKGVSGLSRVILILSEDTEWEDAIGEEIAMTRADLLAVIAGLNNALAALDGWGDE